MAETDTTGAGKTLDKLMSWWDSTFRPGPDRREWIEVLSKVYRREKEMASRLEEHGNTGYSFLSKRIANILKRQQEVLKELEAQLQNLGATVPETTGKFAERLSSVPLSSDLHEVHDLYNSYVYFESVLEDEAFKSSMSRLISDKKWQEEQLFDIVTRIHS